MSLAGRSGAAAGRGEGLTASGDRAEPSRRRLFRFFPGTMRGGVISDRAASLAELAAPGSCVSSTPTGFCGSTVGGATACGGDAAMVLTLPLAATGSADLRKAFAPITPTMHAAMATTAKGTLRRFGGGDTVIGGRSATAGGGCPVSPETALIV